LAAFKTAAEPVQVRHPAATRRPDLSREFSLDLGLRIHSDLSTVESEWRSFERLSDCTAFQTFDWLAAWQRQIGERGGVIPAIVVGRFDDGKTAFILPLAVVPQRLTRRLCWLGQGQCDYNAPLLARDFSQRVTPERFLAAWQEIRRRLQRDPLLRHDWIKLEQMPQTVGAQNNPFTYLGVAPNPSGAHLTQLGGDWKNFYTEKRSSATRRRDRAKLRHMSRYGDIRFLTSADADDGRRTLEILMEQKRRALLRMGITDIFAQPGSRDFFFDLASNPKTRHLVHISRIEVGADCAAANFGLVFGDRYYHVLTSFDRDIEVSRYGPGALHLRKLMAYAIGLGLRQFDFTIGDEPYKLEWSDADLKLWDHTAAATWRGWPARRYANVRRRLKRFIKQTPFAWRLVYRVRAAIGPLLYPQAS
jgi:CelD/BcsL family acetyltransferase involved in cellulose biosynthesis